MIRRHSWMLFALIGSLGLVMGVRMFIDPISGVDMFTRFGADPSSALLAPSSRPFLDFALRWTATALIGVNALTVVIAATAYRRGERWAGVAFLYWPLLFISHLAMYEPGPMSAVQVGWIALTVIALAVHLRRPVPRGAAAEVT